jgi:hypothetical protein
MGISSLCEGSCSDTNPSSSPEDQLGINETFIIAIIVPIVILIVILIIVIFFACRKRRSGFHELLMDSNCFSIPAVSTVPLADSHFIVSRVKSSDDFSIHGSAIIILCETFFLSSRSQESKQLPRGNLVGSSWQIESMFAYEYLTNQPIVVT